MTLLTNTTPISLPRLRVAAISATLGGLWTAIVDWMVAYGDARSRAGRIAALESLSDEELAARGLTRRGIVAHVFADVGFL